DALSRRSLSPRVSVPSGASSIGSSASYTFVAASTTPASPALTVTAQYYTSLSVPVTLGSVTDTGGSGPNASSYVVQRDAIGLAGGGCGHFRSTGASGTLRPANGPTRTNDYSYRCRQPAAAYAR